MSTAMPQIPDILRGCKCFPCVPMGKVPATSNGWKDASADPAKLLEWQSINPAFNWAVACGLSGLFVIDVDPVGLSWLETIKAQHPAEFASAYHVKTPRGGYHYYWLGEGPSTASRIAPGVDTRGAGGYVVLPGSKTPAGTYEALGGDLLPLPDCIRALIPERKQVETKGLERNPDLDQPRNVAWTIDLLKAYVAEDRVSVEGQGGNDLAFRVAASILDKAISPARCLELLLEHWNPHCAPSWDEWELETVVRNAAAYGEETKGGSKGFQSNADAFSAFAGQEIVAAPEATPEKRRVRFRPMTLTTARKSIKPPSWLIPGVMPSEGTGILYGASGSFKSFLALDMALCLANGIPGQWGAAPVPHKILFLAGEQGHSLIGQRVDAWAEWQGGVSPDNEHFIVVQGVPAIRDAEGWRDVREGLLEMDIAPDLIIVDTLARAITGMDENSNNDANLAIGFMEEMAAHYGAFVLAIHHTGKDESKGARGASAFVANIDVAMMVKKRGKSATTLLPKKMKDSDCPDEPLLFQVREFGSSIVLEKTDAIAGEPTKAGKPRTDWSSPDEVVSVLTEAGGRLSAPILLSTIAGKYGLDAGTVRKAFARRPDLDWLRDENGDWTLKELDL